MPDMATLAVIQAVESWAVATVPTLNSYEEAPQELAKALPIVMAELSTTAVALNTLSSLTEQTGYQQTYLRTWSIDLTILSDPFPEWTSSRPLYGYVDALGEALKPGVLLGEHTVMSQFYTANFDPPEIEYADGTRARQVTITVTVGQMIGA